MSQDRVISPQRKPGETNTDLALRPKNLDDYPGQEVIKERLRIFLDRTILEVFANDRQCLTQRIYPTRPDSAGVSLFSTDGKAVFNSVKAWDMAAIEVEPDIEEHEA